MVKVVFVGDGPSSKNVSVEIPFVGASCFLRLVSWIKYLSPDYYVVYNSLKESDLYKIAILRDNGFKIVALGKIASKRLWDRSIPHTVLPHPSGLNLQNNDNEYIQKELELARRYIHD